MDYVKMIKKYEKDGIDYHWEVCPKCGCSEFRLLYEEAEGVPIEQYPICAKCGTNTFGVNISPYKIVKGKAVLCKEEKK